jgi:hypothetical protein
MYNLVGRLVFIVFSLLTGLVVDHVSLAAGLQTLAVFFTVPSAIAVFLLLRHDGWVVPQSGPVTDQARGVVE